MLPVSTSAPAKFKLLFLETLWNIYFFKIILSSQKDLFILGGLHYRHDNTPLSCNGLDTNMVLPYCVWMVNLSSCGFLKFTRGSLRFCCEATWQTLLCRKLIFRRLGFLKSKTPDDFIVRS